MREVWKPVVGYEGFYEVSDQGRVRSLLDRWRNTRPTPKVMAAALNRTGYWAVSLSFKDKPKTWTVHQLVLLAHAGPRYPKGADGAHLDGNRTNNRAGNLKWTTRAENLSHMDQHGTRPRLIGLRASGAKLSAKDVRRIRSLRESGLTLRAIATQYGVAHATVRGVCTGRYSDVT